MRGGKSQKAAGNMGDKVFYNQHSLPDNMMRWAWHVANVSKYGMSILESVKLYPLGKVS